MDNHTLWWLAAGIAVIAEMLTGTFYLLMTALGLAAGALAAHLGASPVVQAVTAAVAGGGAVLLCWVARRRRAAAAPATDLDLDVGHVVQVERWRPDGSAEVHYRGTRWPARLRTPQADAPAGTYRIVAVQGTELILDR